MHAATVRKLALLAASCLYLVLEFAFNAHLLETVSEIGGGRSVNFEPTEYFGRTMASLGFVLLFLSVFSRDGWRLPRRHERIGALALCLLCALPFAFADADRQVYALLPLGAALTIGVIVSLPSGALFRGTLAGLAISVAAFAGMFHGQKIFFQQVTIEGSSPGQRQAARYVNLLRTGLDTGALSLDGMGDLDAHAGTPEHKTFLTLLGGIAWLEPDVAGYVRAHKDGLAKAVSKHLADSRMPELWARYKQARGRFEREVFAPYRDALQKMRLDLDGVTDRANARWSQLQTELAHAYSRNYEDRYQEYRNKMADLAERGRPSLLRWYKKFFDCRSEDCARRVQHGFKESRLNAIAKEEVGRRTRLVGDWCRPREATAGEKIQETIDTIQAALDNPVGTIVSGGLDRDYYTCATSQGGIAWRLRQIGAPRFKGRTNGVPPGLDQEDFERHPAVAERFRKRLAEDGIEVPEDWKPTDRRGFLRAFVEKAEEAADKAYDKAMREMFGREIPKGLSLDQLARNPAVQETVKSLGFAGALTTDFTIDSRSELRRRVLEPRVEARIEREIRALEAGTSDFADGGPRADEGKAAAQLAFVPPLALGASLTLGLLTLVKNAASLVMIPLSGARVQLRYLVQGGVWLVGLVGIALAPFQVSNAFSDSDAFAAAVEAFADESPRAATAAEFVQRIQPVAYPVGSWALDATQANRVFAAMSAQDTDEPRLPEDLAQRMRAMKEGASPKELERHQLELKARGFYEGPIDGLWGRKTRRATRQAVQQGLVTDLMSEHGVTPGDGSDA